MTETSISTVIAAAFADEVILPASEDNTEPSTEIATALNDIQQQIAQPAELAALPKPSSPRKSKSGATDTKSDLMLKKLRLARGVTVAQIVELTGWQPHSVRGFLSGVVRKKLNLNLVNEVGKDGQRRYRIVDEAKVEG